MPKKSTARALIECRRRGWTAGLVERRLPRTWTTVDFLGFADVLALDGEPGVYAIQACGGGSDASKHVANLETIPELRLWLERGNRCAIWSFRKVKVKRGGVAIRWALRELVAEAAPGGVAFVELPPGGGAKEGT